MLRINCLILAAGRSERMGTNKLLLPLGGKSLLEHFLDAFPFSEFQQVVAVCSADRVAGLLRRYPVKLTFNGEPEAGKSLSLRLGIQAAGKCDGLMCSVADQPLLSAATIGKLIESFRKNPGSIVIPYSGGNPANPVIFPAALLPELQKLQGDEGGSAIVKRHEQLVCRVAFPDSPEFTDIDTSESYQALANTWTPGN